MNVELTDKKITIDLYKITIKEYESLFDETKTDADKRALMCKTFGMEPADFEALPMPDGVKLQRAFWEAAREPLKDPNSESASTSA